MVAANDDGHPQWSSAAAQFLSGGVLCCGKLFVPARTSADRRAPCVVLANGFSGTMDWIVPRFAERFAAGGIAAFIFDYRHLGQSDGAPRQIVDVGKQREDLRAAVALMRAQPTVDPARVALWGTSLGGSHVVELAAEDASIAAVVCTMPALDAVKGANVAAKMKSMNVGRGAVVATMLRLLFAAVRDAVAGRLGREPRYIQVYGAPGRAFFTDPSLAERFRTVGEQSPTWQNRVAPRFLFQAPRYRDGTLERIAVPILFSLAAHDVDVSNDFVKAKAAKAARAEVVEYPVGHFDLYHGEAFEQVAADQARFLRRVLLTEH